MRGAVVSSFSTSRIVRFAGLAMLLAAVAAAAPLEGRPAQAEDRAPLLKPITIGFVRHAYGTWTGKIADGSYETAVGRTIRWIPFETDSAVAAAMAGGRIEMGMMGASVAAAAVTRGLDLQVFYVMGHSRDTEGLIVSSNLKFRAGDPKSLMNKVLAVPFGSTAHFRLLQSLRRWGLSPADVRLVNLQPRQIVDAWARSELDAAVVSEPTLSGLKTAGRSVPLPPAGGREGLLVFAAGAEFMQKHRSMLARFVEVIARADMTFTEMSGPLTPERTEIKSIAFLTGLPPNDVIEAIARYRPPRIEDQVSQKWLGGGNGSVLAAELKASADLWKWAGRLEKVEPDYAAAISSGPVEEALSMQR
jgi:taurine transport system substrate-binding protein